MIVPTARHSAAVAALLLVAARPASPQEGVTFKRNVPAVRFTTPPVIDGDLSDPCWQQAAKLDRYVDVLYSTPVKDQTITYLGYDDQNSYVAFHRARTSSRPRRSRSVGDLLEPEDRAGVVNSRPGDDQGIEWEKFHRRDSILGRLAMNPRTPPALTHDRWLALPLAKRRSSEVGNEKTAVSIRQLAGWVCHCIFSHEGGGGAGRCQRS
jgi:hypothetical protein